MILNPTRQAAGQSSKLFNRAQVIDAIRLIVGDGVTELRALGATTRNDRYPSTISGYFDDPEKLADALSVLTSAKGIYITPNEVTPDLLARAANRLRRTPKGESTADSDILRRRWLLIDCDAVRASGISATDAEHNAALRKVEEIEISLHNLGWPDPIRADSGNGGHLMYPIDLTADDGGLVQKCLNSLAVKFNDRVVKVDQSVFNPARIWKLYGTVAAKGDSTPDRPHRMSQIIAPPDRLEFVPMELLEELAATAPATEPKHATNGKASAPGYGAFDLDDFIARNGLDVIGPTPWQGTGRIWTLRTSPLCDHHGDGPFIGQLGSGAITAGCHHESCSWKWHDLRATFEPKGGALTQFDDSAEIANCVSVSAYEPFPIHTLPGPVANYVGAAASAIGCDPAFIALPMLCCLSRAVGNSRVIRLKNTWAEPAIIWASIVGKSGTHKTPALQIAMKFLERFQAKSIADHAQALLQYAEDKALFERAYADWKKSKKTTEPPPSAPPEPVCTRYVTSDCTIEALASLLAPQFDGLLVARDELAGWLGGIAEYKNGKGSDLGHWLASWSAAPLTVDRKTGAIKFIHVPRAAVSLVGGIQPGILRAAIAQEHLQDGLCARLLFAMPEPRKVIWTEATISRQVDDAMGEVFDRLLSLEPAINDEGESVPRPMDLTPEAKTIWIDYYNRHRAELVDLDDDLAAAWSKLEAYTARFALIFQLCSWAAGEAQGDAIDEASITAAVELSDWFGHEAKRVYATFSEDADDRAQRELVELIQRKGGSVTPRDLMRSCRRFKTSTDAEAALMELVKAGSGRWQFVDHSGGRGQPTRRFALTDTVDSADADTNSINPGEKRITVSVSAVSTPQNNEHRFDLDHANRLLAETEEPDYYADFPAELNGQCREGVA